MHVCAESQALRDAEMLVCIKSLVCLFATQLPTLEFLNCVHAGMQGMP